MQANDWLYYTNWQEMKVWLQDKDIEDEYGETCTPQAFINMVERKKDTIDPSNFNGEGDKMIDGYKFHNYEFS